MLIVFKIALCLKNEIRRFFQVGLSFATYLIQNDCRFHSLLFDFEKLFVLAPFLSSKVTLKKSRRSNLNADERILTWKTLWNEFYGCKIEALTMGSSYNDCRGTDSLGEFFTLISHFGRSEIY